MCHVTPGPGVTKFSNLLASWFVVHIVEYPNDPNSLKFLDKEKASILQKQFCSVFVKEPAGEVPMIASRVAEDMPNITITEEDVIAEINSINKNKSCGPDEIDVRMLRELLDFMSKPITA